MTATRLIGFEAAALRAMDALSDEDLQRVLADHIDTFANFDMDMSASDLRELGCAALITARRIEAAR